MGTIISILIPRRISAARSERVGTSEDTLNMTRENLLAVIVVAAIIAFAGWMMLP